MLDLRIKRVLAVYFSATGTTKKIVLNIAGAAALRLKESGYDIKEEEIDFSLPRARQEALCFCETDLVVFGTPVYAGRVPNVLLKYLETIEANGAFAVPVVLFGNRNYDDALIELRDILEKRGCITIAAGAFIGEHSFSVTLAAGRPDDADKKRAECFGKDAADKIKDIKLYEPHMPIQVNGTPHPYRGYYQPKDRHKNPIDIRKVKPVTDENCDGCGVCAQICPMGSIDENDVRELTGICIKCCACIKGCPKGAKRFEDEKYLYHLYEMEEEYTKRIEPQVFI